MHIPASDYSGVNHAQTPITATFPWCNIHLPQMFHWKHCLLYNHTLLRIKRVTGNRQWRITCQAGMLLKKQCHQTIRIWHKYIFTCIILQVNRRLFFPITPLEYRQNVPLSICVHILSSDWIINNMTSIDAFKNIDKNLYIFASQYYV